MNALRWLWWQLRDRAVAAWRGPALLDENETLRAMNELRIESMNWQAGDEIRLTFKDPTRYMQGMAYVFMELLDTMEAPNAMQVDLCVLAGKHAGERIRVTLQRAEGKSPMQLRQLCAMELERVRAVVRAFIERNPPHAFPEEERPLLEAIQGPHFPVYDSAAVAKQHGWSSSPEEDAELERKLEEVRVEKAKRKRRRS
jgi:hypothetical protein